MTRPPGRWWWTATGLVLIVWALEIFPSVSEVSWASVAVVLLVAAGLSTIVASLLPSRSVANLATQPRHHSPRPWNLQWWWTMARRVGPRFLPWVIALMVVAGFLLWSFLQVRADP